jgi:hypothetical protein
VLISYQLRIPPERSAPAGFVGCASTKAPYFMALFPHERDRISFPSI